ncbi:hypothetical protein G7Y89_g7393 [Cudoniella acicularis]|uniref:Uncharacterized protein n=1 Tax=Cudoniella acicularis TaxID=354080 RepID=A0A8H4W207_9HELO|nr:hypothetical protein G7Y89_g7393 [Cudoniella acicularis]
MAVLQTHNGYYLWKYIPSAPAAGIFAALFLIATAAHAWRIHTTKAKFCIAFTVGCFLEFVGYCARASASNKTGKLMPYIIQNLFILISPALFAASIYMTLGRIIRSINGEKYSLIRVNWLTKTFVIGDVLSFLVQGGSAGLMINTSTAKMGQDIVVAGLCIQIIMFGLFVVVALIFQSRMRSNPTPASYHPEIPWKQSLNMLYIVSVLIMIRSIFRVVEFVMGYDGYPLTHEWTLYIFDSVLMVTVTAIFYWRYPSDLQNTKGESDFFAKFKDVRRPRTYPCEKGLSTLDVGTKIILETINALIESIQKDVMEIHEKIGVSDTRKAVMKTARGDINEVPTKLTTTPNIPRGLDEESLAQWIQRYINFFGALMSIATTIFLSGLAQYPAFGQ